ncbi:MAG: cysteine desulfurase family protein, partial [Pseudolabrys sp.]
HDAVVQGPVTEIGTIDLGALDAVLAKGPRALVSVMLANNETGVVQPVSEVAARVHQHGGLLHVDAVQAAGKIPVDIKALGADLLTITAHKLGGPQGIGALILGQDVGLDPLVVGGGQERGRRPGTESVAAIAGFGAAAAEAGKLATAGAMRARRDQLEAGLLAKTPGAVIVGQAASERLPNTTLVAAPGLKGETAVIALDLGGIAVSSGSACSSGKVASSHVLAAMGLAPELARGAVRLSLGWTTTEVDLDTVLNAWNNVIPALLRGQTGVAA